LLSLQIQKIKKSRNQEIPQSHRSIRRTETHILNRNYQDLFAFWQDGGLMDEKGQTRPAYQTWITWMQKNLTDQRDVDIAQAQDASDAACATQTYGVSVEK
jgi:hypothetical protein